MCIRDSLKLVEPIFNIGYFSFVEKVLRCICHNCGRLKYFKTEEQREKFNEVIKIKSASKRLRELTKLLLNVNKCALHDEKGDKFGCGSTIPTKITVKDKMMVMVVDKAVKRQGEMEYSALKVKAIFDKIPDEDRRLLGFTATKPSDMIISILAISPPQVRPSIELGPEKRAEDDITNAYCRIVVLNNRLKEGLDSHAKRETLR